MIINHPLLGPRDAQEFVYLGDAALINRPDGLTASLTRCTTMPICATTRPDEHRELWYHEQGDRSWLVVTRNTVTHEITKVELARDVAARHGAVEMSQIEPHRRRPDRPRQDPALSLRRRCPITAIPATRWPRRFWPTACA